MDVQYFMQLPGLLKPLLLVLHLILFICTCVTGNMVIWFAWILAVIFLVAVSVLILLGYWDNLPGNKPFIEVVGSAILFVLYAIAFIVALVGSISWNNASAYGASAFFIIVILAALGLNGFGHFTQWRQSTVPPPVGGPAVTP